MRIGYIVIASAMVIVAPGALHAQQGNDKAAAEQLFIQGRELMEKGNLDAACERFAASQKLDPALGTLLNLALCREQQGKIASAWALYREAAVQARRDGQTERETVALERAEALEDDLPRLVIRVAEPGQIAGLVVERDGTTVAAALFGVAVYVDPGVHRVVARAPGYRGFSAEIEIDKGKQVKVAIPVLEREPAAPKASEPAARNAGGPDSGPAAGLAGNAGKGGEEAARPGRTRRIVGLGAGGAGVAALAAGLGFGWWARSAWNDAFAKELCDRDALTCTPAGQDTTDAARARALASSILTGTGVALIAAGVVLYVTAPKGVEKAGIAVVPVAGPSEIGITVQGGF